MQNLYLSRAVLACFEGEDDAAVAAALAAAETAGESAGIGGSGAAAAAAAAGNDGAAVKAAAAAAAAGRLTQEQFNKALAEDRRKHQAKLEKTIEEVQARANLTAAEREALATQLEDLRKEGRTKEAQLAHERKQLEEDYEKKLAEKAKAVETWESRYREGTTERALLDAAVSGDAYNTETLMAVLRPMTRLSEITDASGKGTGRFEVKVDFPDTDPNTGEPIKALHTPQSAVKRMKELPTYVNLFKSGVVSGAGANAATGGLMPGSGGKIDVRNITSNMDAYMALRASDPAKLGLRPSKRASTASSFQGFVVRSRNVAASFVS